MNEEHQRMIDYLRTENREALESAVRRADASMVIGIKKGSAIGTEKGNTEARR